MLCWEQERITTDFVVLFFPPKTAGPVFQYINKRFEVDNLISNTVRKAVEEGIGLGSRGVM